MKIPRLEYFVILNFNAKFSIKLKFYKNLSQIKTMKDEVTKSRVNRIRSGLNKSCCYTHTHTHTKPKNKKQKPWPQNIYKMSKQWPGYFSTHFYNKVTLKKNCTHFLEKGSLEIKLERLGRELNPCNSAAKHSSLQTGCTKRLTH